jgi:hypothetical protein
MPMGPQRICFVEKLQYMLFYKTIAYKHGQRKNLKCSWKKWPHFQKESYERA